MKKFLFTLATLIAVGFAANAGAPELAFSTNKLDLTPGGDPVEVKILMTKDAGEVVAGCQLQWVLRDETGARVQNDEVFIVKQNLGTPRVPNYQWFRSGIIMDDMGVPVASSNPFQAKYRLLLANTSTNIILMGDEVEYYTGQGVEPVLATFQIQAADTWDGEYVTVNFECNPKSMEQEGEDEYPLKWSIPGGSQVVADGSMGTIEVNNTEYQPSTTPLTGTVTIGANDGYNVPITVNVNGTYDLVVTVAKDGGEAVEVPVNDGKIVLGVEPDFGTYVINATATGNGDYSGTVTATPATVEIEQPKKADPTINFEVGADGTVNIVIEGATRYEVKVDGVLYDGLSVAPIYDATQEVVVEAWNEAEGYIAGHATNNTTVAEKAYAPAVNPTITFVPGETGVTINVEDYTSYEVIVDGVNMGQINFVEKTWEEQNIVVNAVNEPAHQEKGEATDSYTLAAKDNMNLTGPITIGAVDEDGKVYVSYEGNEAGVTLTATVNGEPATIENGYIQLPTYGDYTIEVTASATHYNDLVKSETRSWVEPGTADTPVITLTPGETGLTIEVENYTSYEVIVDGENMGQINFVEKTWEEQHIVVNATNAPTGMYPAYASKETDLAAKDNMKLKGTLTIGAVDQTNGQIYVSYEGEEEIATIVVTINENRATQTIEGNAGYVKLDQKGVLYDVTATANAAALHYDPMVAGPVQRIWNESEFTTPDPVTSYDEATFTITAQPGENSPEGTVVAIYVGGQKVAEGVGTQTYVIPQTDADQFVSYYATATAPAETADNVYPGMSQSATAFVPAATQPEQPKTAQPGYNVATVIGQQGTFVTLSKAEGEDECEIQYRYMIDNGTWSDWMTYSDMLTFNAAGYYTMEAKAKAANKEWSDPVSFNFTVNPKPTSIDEIMNAENVANVRFFNVAGQEMNEINGMTIVVVTYTNGQTVATKVMK